MAEKRKQAQNPSGPAPATETDVRGRVFKGHAEDVVKPIEFAAEEFHKQAVLRLRDQRLK
jgi:hypothetical protein